MNRPKPPIKSRRALDTGVHLSFPTLPLAGPELAYPVDWQWASALFDQDPGEVGLLTAHVYPLSACAAPGSVAYPSVDAYLQAALVQQTTASLQPLLALAAAAGVPFRVTELGSGTCNGVQGVSNTFASALWSINQLFSLLDDGVDGVTVHLRAGQPNSAVVLDPTLPAGSPHGRCCMGWRSQTRCRTAKR